MKSVLGADGLTLTARVSMCNLPHRESIQS